MKNLALTFIFLFSFPICSENLGVSEDFLERFSSLPSYSSARISPDGKIISVIFKIEEKDALAFFKADDFSLINILKLREDQQVGPYRWVNNERVVININYAVGTLEVPVSYGELFAVNYDLTKPNYIYGIGKKTSSSRKTIVDKASAAYVIDRLVEDPKHILVAAYTFAKTTTGGSATILRLNVYNGQQKSYGKTPPGSGGVLTDSKNEPRFAIGNSTDGEVITYLKDVKEDEWREFTRSKALGGGKITPLAFIENDTKILVLDDTQTSTAIVKAIDVNDLSEEVLFHHPKYDPYPQVVDEKLIAVAVDPGYMQVYWMDDGIEAQIANQLLKTFNDGDDSIASKANVYIASFSEDRNRIIFQVADDISSPKYWFYDVAQQRLVDFLNVWPEIKEKNLSPTKPFKFKNSDGIVLHGYFTNSKNHKEKLSQPLIVLPHGGPIGPRDSWDFDPDVQILSNAGYAVMKINYRGSGGYGKDFLKAGMGEPGGLIQKDIIEATEWVLGQGWADKDRVGIYGGSFGGYSAVQAPILRPDLFKAGVAYVGIFDLNLDFKEGGCQADYSCKSQLSQQWGDDPEKRASMSPVNYAEKLQSPILIVSGEEDNRCPPEQVYALENELIKYKKDYKLIMVPKEGHGFSNPKNRQMFYREMLMHFNKNI
tara:strand:- start:51 stop:2018 length:1968 start_codon:yes stop_codon:yes gene_type:complete